MSSTFAVNPYLNLAGNTEEAFLFYKSVFGGEFTSVDRFKNMPSDSFEVPEKDKEKIMHISLPIGDNAVLMGTDILESLGQKLIIGNNMSISLHPQDLDEARRLFNELSNNGTIEMPLQKMFWGAYFGSFTDKFGIQWLIHLEEKK